jgi:membrane protein DedA with SNARE-associated domain
MIEKMSLLLTMLHDLLGGGYDILGDTGLLTIISIRRVGSYLLVALSSSTKIMVGVALSVAGKYNMLEFILANTLGGIGGIWLYTYFGTRIRNWVSTWRKNKKPMSFARRRKLYQFWHKYGLAGLAIAMPFFSPPVAVGIAVTFREKPKRILLFMSISVFAWTVIFYVLKQAGMAVI